MIVRATVSTKEGSRYRVRVGDQISGPLSLLRVTETQPVIPLAAGDGVIAVFFGSLADGIILGRDSR